MEYKVSDIADINTNSIKKDNMPEIIYYLDTANITDGKVNNVVKYIPNEDKVPSRARRKIKENDILISTVRPNQRHYGFIDKSLANLIVSTGFAVLSPHTDRVDPYYLYLVLTSSSFTQTLQNIAEDSTSAYPSIKPSVIGDQILNLPSTKVQKRISSFVKSIDSKISLNLSTIANLEELSQTIFKRWFVDFEFPNEDDNPYKSSGGEMVDSELGLFPKGWDIKNIEDIMLCQNGYAFYKLGYNNSGYKVVDLGNINIKSQFVSTNKDKYISKEKIDKRKERYLLNKNDLVMIMTDRTQEMNILGRTTRIPESNKYVLNQRIFRLRAKEKYSLTYIQAMLNSIQIRNQLKEKSLGSAQKYINTKHITKLSIKYPDNTLIKHFYNTCEDFFIKSENLREENEKLTQIRNVLLPKLMSGEIELPENLEV